MQSVVKRDFIAIESQRDGITALLANQTKINDTFVYAIDSRTMSLLQSSQSIGTRYLGLRSRCELYPRLENAIAFAIESHLN